jgi:hypothetical protein
MLNREAALDLGEERAESGEDALIGRILQINQDLLDTSPRPVRRGQHPKQHGCVLGEFVVEPRLSDELRHGVFRAPRQFPAIIRFSNGREWDDRKGDIHGMAIKLLDVEGEKILDAERNAPTQDLILADGPVFFIRNLADYVPFSEDVLNAAKSLWGRIVLVVKLLISWDYKWRLLRAATAKKPDSPLRIQYWSQTPYKLGGPAARYTARPDLSLVPAPPNSNSKDRLREAMAAHLASREARFDFLVQIQTDPVAMPVEDPTVVWDERRSPFRKVATIVIPPQHCDTPERTTFCENLSYTPWHSLPAHRPLGGINRARRIVYEAISRRRHELNQVLRHEPSLKDVPVAMPFAMTSRLQS